MADRDHHGFLGDQILQVDIADFFAADFGAAILAVLAANFADIFLDQIQDVPLVRQNAEIFRDLFEQFRVLFRQPLLLEVDQLPQRHPQDGVGLNRGQRIRFGFAPFLLKNFKSQIAQCPLHHRGGALHSHQADLGICLCGRIANNANDLVDIGQRQQQAFDGMLAAASLGQQKLRPTTDHRDPMPNELFQYLFEVQLARFAVDQRQKDKRERLLQRRELVQLIQDHFGIGITFDLDDQPNRFLQITLVANCLRYP